MVNVFKWTRLLERRLNLSFVILISFFSNIINANIIIHLPILLEQKLMVRFCNIEKNFKEYAKYLAISSVTIFSPLNEISLFIMLIDTLWSPGLVL